MEQLLSPFPALDKKQTEKAMIGLFDKYHLIQYVLGQYEDIDDKEKERRDFFCRSIEVAVESLPGKERELIHSRYLTKEYNDLKDYEVYNHILNPPISHVTYAKRRWSAFYKLSIALGVAVFKEDVPKDSEVL